MQFIKRPVILVPAEVPKVPFGFTGIKINRINPIGPVESKKVPFGFVPWATTQKVVTE